MLFPILKYLQPTHYFQLYTKSGKSVFPKIEQLDKTILKQLVQDDGYDSLKATEYDLSWQAVQKGYVGNADTYITVEEVSLKDNYRFIRKNFHPAWVLYTLVLRLASFKNPVKELKAFVSSKDVIRVNLNDQPIIHNGYDNFKSTLLELKPLVSVVIPTLNRYSYLKDVLKDLECQNYRNFEIIIVDQSEPLDEDFYKKFNLDISLIKQNEKALWLARNKAIQIARGDYLLLFDDDSRVKSNWISEHLKCLDYFNADLSSGVSISAVGAKVPGNYSFLRVSDQLDTGNVLLKKAVFEKIGLFDRQFEKQRMGDGEFGLRSYLSDMLNISNPFAERLHLKAIDGGLREMGSWDALRPKNLFAPRPIPSVLYFYRNYFGNKLALLNLFKVMPSSVMPYRFKRSRGMMLLGSIIAIFISPFIVIQIIKSWRLATIKLKQGPQIETLN
ncbi:glycosyltransferase [Subsaxibacter sp. CAU 1640]|uniref:glycosyltransferase n=1 Tax=Subsaxibacter sp. CAU 1640 TaxID=2933271 RepID=UPI002003924A|nr:glycosyltransferase [Subsaxibacter sp. CAU 1640]MCK7589886.1 glycosyltransferase [Subsaxibacter sp. CAU 1640]